MSKIKDVLKKHIKICEVIKADYFDNRLYGIDQAEQEIIELIGSCVPEERWRNYTLNDDMASYNIGYNDRRNEIKENIAKLKGG